MIACYWSCWLVSAEGSVYTHKGWLRPSPSGGGPNAVCAAPRVPFLSAEASLWGVAHGHTLACSGANDSLQGSATLLSVHGCKNFLGCPHEYSLDYQVGGDAYLLPTCKRRLHGADDYAYRCISMLFQDCAVWLLPDCFIRRFYGYGCCACFLLFF